MALFKRILCPTDFSKDAARALEVAIELARELRSELHLLHVVEPPILLGTEVTTFDLTSEVIKAQHETASKELTDIVEHCRATGITAQSELATGSPALTIVEHSRRADLIVMGTRGRTGIQHLLIGSVAERIVRLAKCPVLVVAGQKPEVGASEDPSPHA